MAKDTIFAILSTDDTLCSGSEIGIRADRCRATGAPMCLHGGGPSKGLMNEFDKCIHATRTRFQSTPSRSMAMRI